MTSQRTTAQPEAAPVPRPRRTDRHARPDDVAEDHLELDVVTHAPPPEIERLLARIGRLTADVTLLEDLWSQACDLLPTGQEVVGSGAEYAALRRRWDAVRAELPAVLDARPPGGLPDADDLAQRLTRSRVLGEAADEADGQEGRPAHELADYRSRLSQVRVTAERARLERLSRTTGAALVTTLDGGLI